MKQTFSISEVLKTSWKYLKEQIWVLVGLFIGFMILSFLISAILPQPDPTLGLSGGVFVKMIITMLVSIFISCIYMLGYTKNLFQTIDGMEPQFSAYGQQAKKILTCFVANLIVGIIILIGTCLLIIPGIYLALRLQFYICFIVEEDAGIIDSLKRSWAITEGHAMPLFILALAQIGIMIIGMILLFVGYFVAVPLMLMTYCYVFRQLNSAVVVVDDDVPADIAAGQLES